MDNKDYEQLKAIKGGKLGSNSVKDSLSREELKDFTKILPPNRRSLIFSKKDVIKL